MRAPRSRAGVARLPDGTVGTSPTSPRSHLNNSEKAQNCKHISLSVVGINEVLSKCAQNESLKTPLTCKVRVDIMASEICKAKHGEAVWGYEHGAWESAICDCCRRSGS